MSQGGGLLPQGMRVTQLPQFTLYGDGTVIVEQPDTSAGPPAAHAALPLLLAHLDESALQDMLRVAFDTGCLATARERYENSAIFDAGSTTFAVNAAGFQKVIWVYALSTSIPAPDPAARRAFSRLADALNSFEQRADLSGIEAYDPPFYRVTLLDEGGQPDGAPVAWPWADLTLADWTIADDPHFQTATLRRDQMMKLLDVPNGGHVGVWVRLPDGSTLAELAVRPLLPEELPGV